MGRINLQQQHGQFKKSIGYYTGKSGNRTERVWWLGDDFTTAEKVATALAAQWSKIKADGRDTFNDHDVERVITFTGVDIEWKFADGGTVKKYSDGKYRVMPPAGEVVTYLADAARLGYALQPKAQNGTPTISLADALDQYAASRDSDPTIGKKRQQRIGETMTTAKHYVSQIGLPTMLSAIDRQQLEILTNFIKSRPQARNRKRKQIAPYTVKTLLQSLRMAFNWMDAQADSDRLGGWTAPRRWQELFDIDLNSIRTKKERDDEADGHVQLELAEFKTLYQLANANQKMILLMGLFSAQGQTELACSRREEIDLATATFTHRRNKTGQPGQYWLPDELCEALGKYWKKNTTDSEGLAFRTRQGLPLVCDDANSDSVRQFFDDLKQAAAAAGTPIKATTTFYSLRRYFGHRALQAGGVSLRDAALSHKGQSVGAKHYSDWRDYAAVAAVGRKLYDEMKDLGTFKTTPERSRRPVKAT